MILRPFRRQRRMLRRSDHYGNKRMKIDLSKDKMTTSIRAVNGPMISERTGQRSNIKAENEITSSKRASRALPEENAIAKSQMQNEGVRRRISWRKLIRPFVPQIMILMVHALKTLAERLWSPPRRSRRQRQQASYGTKRKLRRFPLRLLMPLKAGNLILCSLKSRASCSDKRRAVVVGLRCQSAIEPRSCDLLLMLKRCASDFDCYSHRNSSTKATWHGTEMIKSVLNWNSSNRAAVRATVRMTDRVTVSCMNRHIECTGCKKFLAILAVFLDEREMELLRFLLRRGRFVDTSRWSRCCAVGHRFSRVYMCVRKLRNVQEIRNFWLVYTCNSTMQLPIDKAFDVRPDSCMPICLNK